MLSVKVDKTKVKLKRQAKMCVCRLPIQQKKGRKESVEDENKENIPESTLDKSDTGKYVFC